MNESATFFT